MPGHPELREFSEPKLEPGAMLLRVTVAGICGTDRHIYDGHLAMESVKSEACMKAVFTPHG
jgi:L-iditol 2-dehydrogenase